MKHISTIEALLETLIKSVGFHALVIQSPPGWSKSTTVDGGLKRLGLPFIAVGSYTTPLHFYNTLAENPHSVVVLDDCAGLFSDAKTMAILKSATWGSAGGVAGQIRRIAWGSTSDKVVTPAFDFTGRIILLTNTLPKGKETDAFLSRCLSYKIEFSDAEIRKMLLTAAESSEHFEDQYTAKEVAQFLTQKNIQVDIMQMNLRTLRLGYELAKTQPNSWRELLPLLLPKSENDTAPELDGVDFSLPTKDQQSLFQARTGLSRRSFYLYKRRMGLTRPYRARASVARDSKKLSK